MEPMILPGLVVLHQVLAVAGDGAATCPRRSCSSARARARAPRRWPASCSPARRWAPSWSRRAPGCPPASAGTESSSDDQREPDRHAEAHVLHHAQGRAEAPASPNDHPADGEVGRPASRSPTLRSSVKVLHHQPPLERQRGEPAGHHHPGGRPHHPAHRRAKVSRLDGACAWSSSGGQDAPTRRSMPSAHRERDPQPDEQTGAEGEQAPAHARRAAPWPEFAEGRAPPGRSRSVAGKPTCSQVDEPDASMPSAQRRRPAPAPSWGPRGRAASRRRPRRRRR